MTLLHFRAGVGLSLGLTLVLVSLLPCLGDSAPVIHYAPVENLEQTDVALIDRAEHEIDIAAYVLTDWPVMQALIRAAGRGVRVRIYITWMAGESASGSRSRRSGNCSPILKSRSASSVRVRH